MKEQPSFTKQVFDVLANEFKLGDLVDAYEIARASNIPLKNVRAAISGLEKRGVLKAVGKHKTDFNPKHITVFQLEDFPPLSFKGRQIGVTRTRDKGSSSHKKRKLPFLQQEQAAQENCMQIKELLREAQLLFSLAAELNEKITKALKDE